MSYTPPELRMWRTDAKHGRHVFATLSNNPLKPSSDDVLVGVMESSESAQDVVNTHNGVLALYGRRYPTILAEAELGAGVREDEIYFRVNRSERELLYNVARWLVTGPFQQSSVLDKLYQALGGDAEDVYESPFRVPASE